MASFKIVISDSKTRKAYQKEVEQVPSGLLGKKIGDGFPGASLGLEGYSFEITGGSDTEGFPMRRDVDGSSRKRLILSHPPGFHPERKGQRKRKSVRGNTVSKDIAQINAKVMEHGKKSLDELLGAAKKPKKEEGKKEETKKPEEKPAEKAQKEEKKPEEKKEEKPAEKEPAKEEPKKEEVKEPGQEKAEEKMGVKKLED
ncbi:MAG: 30S ribosomal protein S6e [Candidatus Aenigmarchaeota archaeon]|nr:30S ribosomal protein S6e [Candidatus Aenigmarchaeota archaeon]